MKAGDDEATIVLRRSRRPRTLPLIAGVAGIAAIAAATVFVWPDHRPVPAPPPLSQLASPPPTASQAARSETPPRSAAAPVAAPPNAARFQILTGDERSILEAQATRLLVFRYAEDPHILVLSFPSLLAQGHMLNRLAAFVEKAGAPHDRILDEPEMAAEIRSTRDTEETFYLGHDYRVADIARFFATAAHDGTSLRPDETVLQSLLDQEDLLATGAVGALISIPPESEAPRVDATMRATILHHELSHGLYFTDPSYAAHSRAFWDNVLIEPQRAAFRRFLGDEGYDTGIEDLMINETQAYLVHTPDRRFFRPELVGLTEAQAESLSRRFARDVPDSWLKEATLARLGGG